MFCSPYARESQSRVERHCLDHHPKGKGLRASSSGVPIEYHLLLHLRPGGRVQMVGSPIDQVDKIAKKIGERLS
jgi:hypothetical protein